MLDLALVGLAAVLAVSAFAAGSISQGLDGHLAWWSPALVPVLIWQFGFLALAARFALGRAPAVITRLCLTLSFLGSVLVLTVPNLIPSRSVGTVSGIAVSGLAVAGLTVAWIGPSVPCAALLLRLPRTAVDASTRRRFVAGTAAYVSLCAVAALASGEMNVSDLLRYRLPILLPGSVVMIALVVVAAYRSWNPDLDEVGFAAQLSVACALVASSALLASYVNGSFMTARVEAAMQAALPIGVLALVFHDYVFLGRATQIARLLNRASTPTQLQESLREALADPRLELLLVSDDDGSMVHVDGRPADAEESWSPHLQVLHHDGAPTAAILWQRDAYLTPQRFGAVLGVIALAAQRTKLQAQVATQIDELTASRRRLVAATDEARRQVERDLHDGAQQRLAALAMSLRLTARSSGDPATVRLAEEAADDVGRAMAELQELSRGLHPAALTDAGVAGGVQMLADRCPVAIDTTLTAARFDPTVELTAYFVVAEALANSLKHAPGAHIKVVVTEAGDDASVGLLVLVTDDGPGTIDASRGSGLVGLRDRVHAVGGSMEWSGTPGSGATVSARLPASPPLRGSA